MDWVLERELNNTDAITPTESQTEIAERSKNCILEKYKDAKYEVPAYGAVYVAEQLAGSCLNNVQLRNSISKFDYDIYLKYEFPSLTCSIPNATENIVRVVDSSGVIVNSMAMLNHVKKRLELSTGHVLNDSPYTTRPSISITSNEVNYDFMPAILVLDRRDNNRKFLVPLGGRSSDWQFSDPITERRMLDDANQNTNGSLKKVILWLKFWRARLGWDIRAFSLSWLAYEVYRHCPSTCFVLDFVISALLLLGAVVTSEKLQHPCSSSETDIFEDIKKHPFSSKVIKDDIAVIVASFGCHKWEAPKEKLGQFLLCCGWPYMLCKLDRESLQHLKRMLEYKKSIQ